MAIGSRSPFLCFFCSSCCCLTYGCLSFAMSFAMRSKLGRRLAPEGLGAASVKVKMLSVCAIHKEFIQISPHLASRVSPGKPLHLDVQPEKEGHMHAGSLESGLAGSLPRFSRAWLACETLLGRDLAVGVELQRASEDAGHAVFLGVAIRTGPW